MKKKKDTNRSSNSRKFPWKIISAIILLLAIIGIIIGFAVDWSFPKWIFISGSSTMQPLLQSISKEYKACEVTADAGGSAIGIQDVLKNNKNIGAASKTPDVSMAGIPEYNGKQGVPGEDAEKWKNEKMKTITIAWDGIGIVYKKTGPLKDKQLVLTPQTIQWLYLAFAGYTPVNAQNLIPNSWTLDVSNKSNNIIPFARTGGSTQSGTAESFTGDSRLLLNDKKQIDSKFVLENIPENAKYPYSNSSDFSSIRNDKEPIDNSVWGVLTSGKYGPLVMTTSESNLQTWQSIKDCSSTGVPITYLSAGFIKNNYQEIINSGFGIASYSDNIDGSSPVQLIQIKNGSPSNDSVSHGYDWFRPLNLILKDDSKQYIENFIEWILGNSLFPKSSYRQILDEEGFIPLTIDQISSMFNDTNKVPKVLSDIENYLKENPDSNYDDFLKSHPNPNWSSLWTNADDYSLIQTPNYTYREQQQIWYGAIPKTTK